MNEQGRTRLRTLLPAVVRQDDHSISLFWKPPAHVLLRTDPVTADTESADSRLTCGIRLRISAKSDTHFGNYSDSRFGSIRTLSGAERRSGRKL